MPGPPTGGRPASPAKRIALALLGDPPPRRARLTESLERWISGYRPDVLYTILGDNAMMDLVEAVRRRFDLPLIVHIMDDWPAAAYRSGAIGPAMRRGMERRLRHLFDIASRRFAISPAMADAYQRRYDQPFDVFLNTIDVALRSSDTRTDAAVGETAEILYVGSIFPNAQLASLIDCARAVARLAESGRRVRLRVSSPSGHGRRYAHLIACHPAVTVEDAIEDDDTFYRRVAAADLLLLPVNFDGDSVRFIRYSMPTKVPAYLVSGTPILAYGPMETAQIAYAHDNGWAHIVRERDIDALAQGIRRVLEDTDLRRTLIAAARRTAQEHHDARQVRTQFQSLLRESAGTRLQRVTP